MNDLSFRMTSEVVQIFNRTVQLDLIQANMGADTSPYNRDFCYGSVTVTLRLRYVFMTSQGDLLTWKIPFSERPGSDQMSKFVLKHSDVKNIITRTLMDTNGDAYRIGDAEWDHGLRSDVVYEPMHVSLDQPPIIVEVQATVNADFMNRAAHYCIMAYCRYKSQQFLCSVSIMRVLGEEMLSSQRE
ncbi:hypothetical protein RMATCC62417_05934 [Rhizopus microsporus]|nr:hypothetical protein RMATCC62417_05934 [Rhizopus microsporus]